MRLLITDKFKKLFKRKSRHLTFTYYVPSPPQRSCGYRELELDKALGELVQHGCKIISLNTQMNSNKIHSGMWVICEIKIPRSMSHDEFLKMKSTTPYDSNEIKLDEEFTVIHE